MPRPKNTIPTIEKTVSLPEDVVAAIDLELFSEVEGKVPFGAWKGFLTRLAREHLAKYRRIEKLTADMQAAVSHDPEGAHAKMDELLRQYLLDTGAYEAARIYTDQEKWYA